ncbi:gastrula zinc finger protein XlCGF26.1-like isoform X2 [Eleutherodactylus coqui]|uniref:gastrula zinc finger protein XlCGF26.1-like isoform X2 n=1 Tax=Eleutherodactylus coqui TaxID=57060 RepID=UPI0034632090
MDQDKSFMAESILNITLEIIYLLTGEDYTVVRKASGEPRCTSGRRSRPRSPIKIQPPRSLTLEGDPEQKILDLTRKIIGLITGKVPAGQYLEEPKDLYRDEEENHEPLSPLDGFGDRRKQQRSSSLLSSDYTEEEQSDPQDTGADSLQIKVEVVEMEDDNLYSHSDVQCKDEEKHVAITKSNARIRNSSSSDWESKDNNSDNFPEENCSFQNRHPGLQDVHISNELSNDEESTPDKSTFSPYGVVHTGEIYTCSECGKCFRQLDELLVHERAHVEGKTYPCYICGKSFKKKSNLIQHERIHTGEKPFLCSDCGKNFTRKADLIKHQRIHTGEKPFPCIECGKCFTQISALIRHRRFHSDGHIIVRNTSEDQPILSPDCKIEDKPVSETLPGENSSFANVPPVLQYADINSDLSYPKDGSPDQSDFAVCSAAPKSDKIFPCLECDKLFTQYAKLLIHQRSHTGEKPFSCCYCGKRFTEKSNLIQHERIHSGEKRFMCSECGKGFTRKADLIKHLRTHTGEKPFHCLECGKCFTQNSALLRHKRFHTGEKPFECLECGKRFTHRPALNKHQKIHNREMSEP